MGAEQLLLAYKQITRAYRKSPRETKSGPSMIDRLGKYLEYLNRGTEQCVAGHFSPKVMKLLEEETEVVTKEV